MHALVIEAVIAAIVRSLAEAGEIFRARAVGDVMLAGHGVQFAGAQVRQQLRSRVEFRRLGQMGDVAGVDGECGARLHRVHQRDGLFQGARDIGIGVLVEADMGVADLQEQRHAGRLFGCRLRQADRRQDAARQGEKRARAAKGQTLQRAAAGRM